MGKFGNDWQMKTVYYSQWELNFFDISRYGKYLEFFIKIVLATSLQHEVGIYTNNP